MEGQIWRLVTFIFIPSTFSFFSLLLSLYFYYMIGTTLEREWGTLRFNLYYLTGTVLTIIYSLLSKSFATAHYLNLSMFFAFATLFPDFQILLFFILPIKIKYLAYVNAALFLVNIIFNRFPENLLPSLPLLTTLFTFIPKSSTSLRPSALPQRTRSPLRRRSAIKRKGVICTAAQPVARRILITPIWNSVTVQFVGDMLAIVGTHYGPHTYHLKQSQCFIGERGER